MRNILITGATGFLGWNIVRDLLSGRKSKVFILARDKSDQKASDRISDLLAKDFGEEKAKIFAEHIEVVEGDITLPDLGIKRGKARRLIKEVDAIYHCAALCEFGVPLEPISKINVGGTRNVLNFAMECRENREFKSVIHISTLGIAGKSGGVFREDDLDIGQGFNNTYEQTKFEAEKLVAQYRQKGVCISVFRPAIITGDSKTGEVSNFQMLYQPLHIFSLELFGEIPANKILRYNLVPVDYVAKAICLISSNENNNKNYHLANPSTITLEYFLDAASSYFGFDKPRLVNEPEYDHASLTGFRRKLLEPYLPYFNHKKIVFDTSNFTRAVDGKRFQWPKIDEKLLLTLFRYCDKAGYIKQKKAERDELLVTH